MSDKVDVTITAYNKNSKNFADKFMEYDPYTDQISEFAKLLHDGFSVLDIGCGPGNVVRQLCATKELAITGIDLSVEMVELAKRNVPEGVFHLQDLRQADFMPEAFDAIILSFCIVHLETEEAKAVLRNAIKWLRRGGYIYLSFMEGKTPGFESTSFSEELIYFNYFAESEINNFLELNGLECARKVRQDYKEPDGSITVDVFLFLQKL